MATDYGDPNRNGGPASSTSTDVNTLSTGSDVDGDNTEAVNTSAGANTNSGTLTTDKGTEIPALKPKDVHIESALADAPEVDEGLQRYVDDAAQQESRGWFLSLFHRDKDYSALNTDGGRLVPGIANDPVAASEVDAADATFNQLNDASINHDTGMLAAIGHAPMANMDEATAFAARLVQELEGIQDEVKKTYKEIGEATDGSLGDTLTAQSAVGDNMTPLVDMVRAMGNDAIVAGTARNRVVQAFDLALDDARLDIQDYIVKADGKPATGPVNFTFKTDEVATTISSANSAFKDKILPNFLRARTVVSKNMANFVPFADGGMASVGVVPGSNGEIAGSKKDGSLNNGGSKPPAGGSSGGGGGSRGGSSSLPGRGSGARIKGGSSPSGKSGSNEEKKRAVAAKIADLINQGRGGGGGQTTMPVTFPSYPEMPQMPQMPGMAGADPSQVFGGPQMQPTSNPYEALLNPTTHLTQGFTPGDMGQLRQGMVPPAMADMARPFTQEARTADQMIVSPPAPQSGQDVPRRTALGADMKPLDRTGDGKVDPDSKPATKANTTDENGDKIPVDTAVNIGGEEHPVTVDDPRLLEMMNIVGEDASPENPIEILDAAEKAGVPLSSYGEMLDDPTQAKAGDVVISSKGNGFYLGDGDVLMEDGEVKRIGEVLELRPPQSGIFHLELPELPDGDDGIDDEPAPGSGPEDDAPADGEGDGEAAGGGAPVDEGVADGEPAPAPEEDPAPAPEEAPAEEPAPDEAPADEPAPATAEAGDDAHIQAAGQPDAPVEVLDADDIVSDDTTDKSGHVEDGEPDDDDDDTIAEGRVSGRIDAAGMSAEGEAEFSINDIREDDFEGRALG